MTDKARDQKNIIIDDKIFNVFGDDFDRFDFPADIQRVTAGNGGEALLINGSEKTALLDCGMAYCGSRMVENLKSALQNRGRSTLDIVFPAIRTTITLVRFPWGRVRCHGVCEQALQRDPQSTGMQKKLMKELGGRRHAIFTDPGNTEEIIVDGLAADRVLVTEICIAGKETVAAIETKGHTDCSMSYYLEPYRILFTSESTRLMETSEYVYPILKSYDDAIVSMKNAGHAARIPVPASFRACFEGLQRDVLERCSRRRAMKARVRAPYGKTAG